MEAFTSVSGVAAPLMQINIDTDQIIPTTFLGGTDAKGYGKHLFHERRFMPDGTKNPDFILNQPPYDQAQVLLADRNFGCGSSRERAVWALREFGIQAVIAPSFGEIFFNNCWRNAVVPVVLPIESVNKIADAVARAGGDWNVTVDLEALAVTSGGENYSFTAPPVFREMLLKGLDEIELTLSRHSAIAEFRREDRLRRPWTYGTSTG
jgi:3-isopropylmalate/(R)-2-methylmalate dehydratase small subunit